jgi:predicted RNA-binding Zn-ribbon protein involved in translation (DUF1610 family)
MANLHCPNCGKLVEVDSVGDFTVRWSTKKCLSCGVELSIRYEPEAMFVRFSQKAKVSNKKIELIP